MNNCLMLDKYFFTENIQKENVDLLLRLRSFQVSPNT